MDMPTMLPILISWVTSLSGYPTPDEAPRLEYRSHRFFVEHVCGNKECNALGWYNDAGVIYVDKKFRYGASEFAQSLIVHELVHYLQHKSGKFDTKSCRDSAARELEAYHIQNRYIVEARLSIDVVRPPPTVCDYANAMVNGER